MNLELADVEVFLALAEELHFRRTAARLLISPARVSQRIQAVEREVGGALFERTSRRVVLTPLGRQLRDALLPAHGQFIAGITAARASARAAAGLLRIGFTETTGGQDLDRLVRDLERSHPGIEASLREIAVPAPLDALRHDRVDVLVDWLTFDAPDITLGPALAEYSRVLLVAADHPLADRSRISFEEVADYEVNDMPRNDGGNRPFFPDRTRSGRRLRLHPVSTWNEAQSSVARHKSVHVTVTLVTRTMARTDLALVPIDDLPPLRLGLLWRTAHENARIRALAALCPARPSDCKYCCGSNTGTPLAHTNTTP
ncbi:LysR family transcriptional regulator [Actinomadura sp. NAK00032]|uniref:LysR family transcriptional regulator n=1 Tax=Actinomadura sp. NAK00032 TaxID=2742128 RepID=UPI00158FEDC2|nr:LysR family transcriptional regulator [Actinomadura sp. NAK00032]QKW33330.1 LysR family transcriptional regulator [Actinomadura sp. NAK00032]